MMFIKDHDCKGKPAIRGNYFIHPNLGITLIPYVISNVCISTLVSYILPYKIIPLATTVRSKNLFLW
jgi:hypothetical protein